MAGGQGRLTRDDRAEGPTFVGVGTLEQRDWCRLSSCVVGHMGLCNGSVMWLSSVLVEPHGLVHNQISDCCDRRRSRYETRE